MPRPKQLHGAAIQNSGHAGVITIWLSGDPRMSPGKIQKRLISRFGKEATFSIPTIRSWMQNYYPEIVRQAIEKTTQEGEGGVLSGIYDTELFGKVADSLEYNNQMIRLLESHLKGLDEMMVGLKKDAASEDIEPELRIVLSRQMVSLSPKITQFTKEIRAYREHVEEYQKAHDFGERMGDLLQAVVELVYSEFTPALRDEDKQRVLQGFKDGWKKIGHDFGVPTTKIT